MYGDGTLDGNGQVWYDLYAKDALILRPILMGIIGLKGGTIGPLKLRYSPQWYHFVANSTDVLFDGIDITGFSSSKNVAKNTDGWYVKLKILVPWVLLIAVIRDLYRSSNIVIQNSVINNGDGMFSLSHYSLPTWTNHFEDCVSFKPNSTEILVQNLHCNGSHGISVGSLGQYEGEVDIVQNVLVYNISMFNASVSSISETTISNKVICLISCVGWCSHQSLAWNCLCALNRSPRRRWIRYREEHYLRRNDHRQCRLCD
jgi:galacturan 1,4-alpha-galacturonidase